MRLRFYSVRCFLRLPVTHKPLIISFGTIELPTLVHDSWNLYGLRTREKAPSQILPIAGADHFSILRELQMPEGALVRAATSLVQNWA